MTNPAEAPPARPRAWRVVLAFLAAAPAGGLAMLLGGVLVDEVLYGPRPGRTLLGGLHDLYLVAVLGPLLIGYPLTVVISLPLYFLLRNRVGYGVLGPILVGGVTTLLPCALLGLASGGLAFGKGPMPLLVAALVGGSGGFVFWVVAAWRDPRLARGAGPGTVGRPARVTPAPPGT